MKAGGPYRIQEYLTEHGESPYRNWLNTLDLTTKARVQARVLRFELGNLCDYKSVGAGVYEARLDFGPGYRIYFGLSGQSLLLLLCGGAKRTQRRDIQQAQKFWFNYVERGKNGKTRTRVE